MTRLLLITAAVAAAAVFAATALAVPSGDTCTFLSATNGTEYTVNIVTGAGIQQYGFAFHAPGLTIKNVSVSGRNGTFSTSSGLPPGATGGNWGGWTSDESMNGTVSATLTVTGKATGPIEIVPSGTRATPATTTTTGTTTTTTTAAPPAFYDTVTCKESSSSSATTSGTVVKRAVAFSVASRAVWNAAKHGWLLSVRVPTAGLVSAVQPVATTAQPQPAQVAPHPLVQVRRVQARSAGSVTLTIKPTPRGQAALSKAGKLHVSLRVTFDASGGREGHKTISLTLRK
jgi:hypothetical protein